jgi:hypothetical protein
MAEVLGSLVVLGSLFVISIGDTPTRPTLIFQGVS